MSRRAKFAFITWIGPGVPPLKKAKVSTDKAFVKQLWQVSSPRSVYHYWISLLVLYLLVAYIIIIIFDSLVCSQEFGKEILADERGEVKEDKILSALEKASGAAYGTGKQMASDWLVDQQL